MQQASVPPPSSSINVYMHKCNFLQVHQKLIFINIRYRTSQHWTYMYYFIKPSFLQPNKLMHWSHAAARHIDCYRIRQFSLSFPRLDSVSNLDFSLWLTQNNHHEFKNINIYCWQLHYYIWLYLAKQNFHAVKMRPCIFQFCIKD